MGTQSITEPRDELHPGKVTDPVIFTKAAVIAAPTILEVLKRRRPDLFTGPVDE